MTELIDWSVWRPLDLVEREMAPRISQIALHHFWDGWSLLACRSAALVELQRALHLVGLGGKRMSDTDAEHAAFLNSSTPEVEMIRARYQGAPDEKWRRFALDRLEVQIAAVGAYHAEGAKLARAAAGDALKAGADRRRTMEAAVTVARTRMPLLPPWMVQDAVESEAKEARFAGRFWDRRERTG